ncbi:MAG: phosphoglycerate dehydrogenase [Sulfurospirillaceae bacterium]|nr:phosphoglycerate dehydrogenase [Sulfurospirillaceae bacterium]
MIVNRKKIIICDAIHQKGFQLLEKEDDIEVIDAVKLSKDELLNVVGSADIAITRSPTAIDSKFLAAATNLKAIVRAGVGVDNVDLDGCSKRGIIAMNVPTANTIAAVELTMAHMLSTARSFTNANNHLKIERVWKREKWYGIELSGKKLGIIGFGNIGSRVGVRAKAFGMDVIAYDPYIAPSKATDLGVSYTENFDDILACDFITIHTPKNKETTGIISYDEIAKMKDGVRLINCARGSLYDEKALYDGLKSGKIAFAGIDVFSYEPATDHPLLDLENICVTPHLGANTVESQEKIATQAAECALNAARGVSYPNALNLPIKAEELPSEIVPYLELIQKMSYFAAQINKSQIKSIRIRAEGNVSKYAKSLLTFSIVGALKESIGDKINYVNASYVAKEKNIETAYEEIANSSSYHNKVTVTLTTQKGVSTVSGTVFEEVEQRIVNINGFGFDFKPKGKMIVFKNKDIPGAIASIATLLAKHGINIADFRLGRGKDDFAMAVILVDEPVDKKILTELNSLDACLWAEYAIL